MFIGHIGVGLALKKIDQTINAGWLVFAALLLDILLWVCVFFGIETVIIPDDYAVKHYLFFEFPFTHSLIASALWATLVFVVTRFLFNRSIAAWILALTVFSHFILDALVHPAQIPLLGNDSLKIGLGLWNSLYVELIVEVLLLSVGFWIYLKSASLTRRNQIILGFILVMVTIMTVAGQLMGPAPESSFQAAVSAFSLILLLIIIFLYFDKKPSTT